MYSTYASQASSNFTSHPFANRKLINDFPSVREQVELCRSIASQLVANDNVRSKGASMFFKRVKKAHTWEVPPLDQKEQETLDNEDDEKTRQKLAQTLLNNNERSATQRLSLVLDPRGRIHSLSSLKAEGAEVVEHDAVDPDVMSKLVKDLESPEVNPRAAELFAKRKSMAKEWEVEAKDTPNIEASNYINTIISNGNNNNVLKEVNSIVQPKMDDLRITPKPQQQQPQPRATASFVNNNYNFNGNTTLPRRRTAAGVRPDFASKQQQASKRFSLLDPDVFVPAAGSGLSSTPYSSATRAPSPWKPQATLDDNRKDTYNGLSRHSSMRQASCSPVPQYNIRSQSIKQVIQTMENKVQSMENKAPKPFAGKSSAPLKPPPPVAPSKLLSTVNDSPNHADGNHFYNYFYQTLKHSNPYQDLPESVLL